MKVKLIRANVEDANVIWKIQKEAFAELYQKYQDTYTSPATEPLEKVVMKLNQPFTYYYFIQADEKTVGAIRVVDEKENKKAKRISPIFILKQYRNRGIAQKTIKQVELIHGGSNWKLDTILQEEGNCHLYEKMGYYQMGNTEKVNDKLTLVFYKKD